MMIEYTLASVLTKLSIAHGGPMVLIPPIPVYVEG